MTVNGEQVVLKDGITLETFIAESGYDIKKTAVELNREIVPKSRYAETVLCDSDRLEVVTFVGGG